MLDVRSMHVRTVAHLLHAVQKQRQAAKQLPTHRHQVDLAGHNISLHRAALLQLQRCSVKPHLGLATWSTSRTRAAAFGRSAPASRV